MTTQPTINEQIAGALGDARGSYELLIGRHICDALGVSPTHRGHLAPRPSVSSQAVEWVRKSLDDTGVDSVHAREILAVITDGTSIEGVGTAGGTN